MIAMMTDANNKIYPLAFAIVKSESKSIETWGWFLAYIRTSRLFAASYDKTSLLPSSSMQ